MLKYIQTYCFICFTLFVSAQTDPSECLKTVLAIEDSIFADRKTLTDKVAFVHYKVRSEDWDKAVVQSEVKLYQDQKSMHFFSDQVDIFSNESELFMVLKPQKMILAQALQKNVKSKASEDEFMKFKKSFLKNCEIQSCYFSDSVKGTKVLKLKVKDDLDELVAIKTMTYKIDTKQNKILQNSITYSRDYKLKKMDMTYLEYKFINSYNFSKPQKLVLTSKGKLLEKYKTYEFIDERN